MGRVSDHKWKGDQAERVREEQLCPDDPQQPSQVSWMPREAADKQQE